MFVFMCVQGVMCELIPLMIEVILSEIFFKKTESKMERDP